MKEFNPCYVYDILYGGLMYGDIHIFPHMGYWIGAYIRLLIFVLFIVMHYYFILYSIYVWFTFV